MGQFCSILEPLYPSLGISAHWAANDHDCSWKYGSTSANCEVDFSYLFQLEELCVMLNNLLDGSTSGSVAGLVARRFDVTGTAIGGYVKIFSVLQEFLTINDSDGEASAAGLAALKKREEK